MRHRASHTRASYGPPRGLAGVLRTFGAVALGVTVCLASGGIPGSRLRSIGNVSDGAPVPSEVTGRDGTIDVTVRAAEAGLALAGARVRALAIIDDQAYLADQGSTDPVGRARMVHLPRGELWLLADAAGYARGSSHIIVDAAPRTIVLELGPGHAFDVVVRDELGAPVSGGEVEAVASSDPLPVGAQTGTDGVAHMQRLGPGPWRVTARAGGYEEMPGRAERDAEVVAITLRRLGALDVHVQAEGDRAAADARVSVAGATLWPPRAAETDAQGNVRIAGLVAGIYALRATRGQSASPIELGVSLERGEEKSVELRLGPGRFVGVRVTDGESDDAAPIAGARVLLAEGGLSPFPLETTTDARGRARLGPVAPGTTTIGAQAKGFVGRGAILVADPPPFETRVALVRAGVLTGRVVDTRGVPVAGATIELVGTDLSGDPIFDDPRRARFQAAQFASMLAGPAPFVAAGELGVVPGPVPPVPFASLSGAPTWGPHVDGVVDGEPWVTRYDGTFRATPASPGRIRAIVHHPEFVESESDIVGLSPGGESHVEVVLHEGGSLEGRVVDAYDRPVQGARVVISAMRTALDRTTRTASDGTFSFADVPDALSLGASAGDDDEPEVRLHVSVPEGGRQEVTLRLPEERGPLPVTVVDDRGWPIATAQITASSLSTDSLLRTTVFTGADGEAQLKRAHGVPLRIEIRAPSHAPRVWVTDASTDALRVELAAAESAAGQVVTAREGEPIGGADVTLYTDLGARHARTDAQGAFALTDLAAGATQLRVTARQYASYSDAITIPDSRGRRPFEIDRIAMAAECVAEGDVVDARGEPVAGARVARDGAPTWLRVGSTPEGLAITDARGRFRLGELPEGPVTLEAYAPEAGRTRATVDLVAGRSNEGIHLTLGTAAAGTAVDEPPQGSSVAVTLGETGTPAEVVIVSVVEGSEAERAGVAPGDVLRTVDGATVGSIEDARARLSGPLAEDVLVTVERDDRTLSFRMGREPVRR
jgi:carboxypeptidase family protein/PDZ domain-containing protein